jgi:hypothetical protein
MQQQVACISGYSVHACSIGVCSVHDISVQAIYVVQEWHALMHVWHVVCMQHTYKVRFRHAYSILVYVAHVMQVSAACVQLECCLHGACIHRECSVCAASLWRSCIQYACVCMYVCMRKMYRLLMACKWQVCGAHAVCVRQVCDICMTCEVVCAA